MMRRVLALLLFIVPASVACQRGAGTTPQQHAPQQPAQAASRSPTATEVFHLRSECAGLAATLFPELADNISPQAGLRSHYDPASNRCYVEMATWSQDADEWIKTDRYLYDGQTREQLAFAHARKDKSYGEVFPVTDIPRSQDDNGYTSACRYIDRMMFDDRKR